MGVAGGVVLGVGGRCRVSQDCLLALVCWLQRLAVACVSGWVPLRMPVAPQVGALGAGRAWLDVGACVDALLAWACLGLSAVRLLLPCAWQSVLFGGPWLVCALR